MADNDTTFPIAVSATVPVHAMLDAIERHKADMGGYLPLSVRTRLVALADCSNAQPVKDASRV